MCLHSCKPLIISISTQNCNLLTVLISKLTSKVLLLFPDVIEYRIKANNLYYFSNEVTDALATRGDLHLSKVALGVDGANDVIKKSGGNYRYHHMAFYTNVIFRNEFLSRIRLKTHPN